MAAYDIGVSASTSSSATGGTTGAFEVTGGGAHGGKPDWTVLGIIGALALCMGVALWFIFRK